MNKTVDGILEDLVALEKDLESRIAQAEDTENYKNLKKWSWN